MDNDNLEREYRSLASGVAFGRHLGHILEALRDLEDATALQESSPSTVSSPWIDILIDLVDSLDLFDGRLVLEHAWVGTTTDQVMPAQSAKPHGQSAHVCALASVEHADRAREAILLSTANALPSAAADVIAQYAGQQGREARPLAAIVFLGRQPRKLTATTIENRIEAIPSDLKRLVPLRYLHTDDLLGEAESMEWTAALVPPALRFEYRFGTMPRRERSILIGNGINRINNNAVLSWDNVLAHLRAAIDSTCHPRSIESSTVPSPIRFECLADHQGPNPLHPITQNVFVHLKELLSQLMTGTYPDPKNPGKTLALRYPPQTLVTRLRQLPVHHILTTNYDQMLEACLGTQDLIFRDRKYLFNPTGIVVGQAAVAPGGRSAALSLEFQQLPLDSDASVSCKDALLYHIHGIAAKSHHETICIGYEHYMGYVQRIRERLIQNASGREVARRIVYLMLGITAGRGTWEELFFASDMAIVGLGLDYEESDLWELLTLRGAVMHTSNTLRKYLHEDFPTNHIVFYDIEEVDLEGGASDANSVSIDDHYHRAASHSSGSAADMDSERWLDYRESKRQTLLDLGVEVRIAHVSKGQYEMGYAAILDDLLSRGW